jgi:hypothetical protein
MKARKWIYVFEYSNGAPTFPSEILNYYIYKENNFSSAEILKIVIWLYYMIRHPGFLAPSL